jgi:type I restriction enzyme S subunit
MKPSGIEWLGDVPSHWVTPSLYVRYSSELGKMLDSSKITGDHLIPYVRNVDVQWGAINLDDLPFMDIREGEYQRYTLKAGDLLICEGGEVGRAAIVPTMNGVFGYQKALHRLRALNKDENTKFMYFTLLWAANTGVFNLSGSSTIAHLTGEQLRKYRFPKPPIAEQAAIVAYLDTETAKLGTLTTEAQRAIDLLQERRAALISAATTGKIDVRPFTEQEAA